LTEARDLGCLTFFWTNVLGRSHSPTSASFSSASPPSPVQGSYSLRPSRPLKRAEPDPQADGSRSTTAPKGPLTSFRAIRRSRSFSSCERGRRWAGVEEAVREKIAGWEERSARICWDLSSFFGGFGRATGRGRRVSCHLESQQSTRLIVNVS
jgi:hypothetical protein